MMENQLQGMSLSCPNSGNKLEVVVHKLSIAKYFVVNQVNNIMVVPVLFALVLISGCAKPLPKFEIPSNARIGIINFIENEATHSHIGTTVFNNFVNKYEVDWKIPEIIQSEIILQLDQVGRQGVVIEPTKLIAEHKDELIVIPWDEFYLNKKLVNDFAELAEKYGVDLIFAMRTYQSGDLMRGYGLHTRSMATIGVESYAYANIRIDAIWTRPPTLVGMAWHRLITERLFGDNRVSTSGDLRHLSADDLRKIEFIIKFDVHDLVRRALIEANLVDEQRVATLLLTCSKPYELDRDCSLFGGAKRVVEIDGWQLNVAGSNDGKNILVMTTQKVRDDLKNRPYPEIVELRTAATNKCFKVVEDKLKASNINVTKTVKVVSANGAVDGYLVELDGDGYSILKKDSK